MTQINAKRNGSIWPADEPEGEFKAIVPNGVARDKGRNPQQQSDRNENTSWAGMGGWKGNRTGE